MDCSLHESCSHRSLFLLARLAMARNPSQLRLRSTTKYLDSESSLGVRLETTKAKSRRKLSVAGTTFVAKQRGRLVCFGSLLPGKELRQWRV
jgi:hypothetical protein